MWKVVGSSISSVMLKTQKHGIAAAMEFTTVISGCAS